MLKHKKLVASLTLLVVAGTIAGGERAYHWYLVSRDYADPPTGMLLVPAGDFLIGTDNPEASKDERPQRKRFLPAFYMDTYEVTNALNTQGQTTH